MCCFIFVFNHAGKKKERKNNHGLVPATPRRWPSQTSDVSLMVKDIRYVEQTGRQRDRAWAHAGDREGMRRSLNTDVTASDDSDSEFQVDSELTGRS